MEGCLTFISIVVGVGNMYVGNDSDQRSLLLLLLFIMLLFLLVGVLIALCWGVGVAGVCGV